MRKGNSKEVRYEILISELIGWISEHVHDEDDLKFALKNVVGMTEEEYEYFCW